MTDEVSDPQEPKKRDRQATMQKLFDAALEVFSELGFDGATTKLVAQRADVTESLIVKYFGSKRGLLLALFDNFCEKKANAETLPYPAGKNLEEEFVLFIESQIQSTLQTKAFTRAILGHASVDEEMRQELARKVPLDWHPVLKERLKRYREAGEIPRGMPIEDLIFMLGFRTFSTLYVGHMLLEMPSDDVRTQIIAQARIFAAGLRALASAERTT